MANEKLSNVASSYTIFEKDQVLTAGQLNSCIEYNDDQIRLTRTYLSGIGIACGLNYSTDGRSIRLSNGFGITSDGDLLALDNSLSFTHWKSFDDKNAAYTQFIGADKKTIAIKELLSASQSAAAEGSIASIPSAEFIGYTLVYYLESYVFDPDICTGISCDNKGKQQINNPRYLLLKTEDARRIGSENPDTNKQLYFQLRDFAIPRIVLGNANIDFYADLYNQYGSIILSVLQNQDFRNTITESYTRCGALLGDSYMANPVPIWNTIFESLITMVNQRAIGVQYIYDFLNDLIDAYNEYKEEIFQNTIQYIPDYTDFPKHLIIGSLSEKNSENDSLRTSFYESPVVNSGKDAINKIRILHRRIHRIIINFKIPDSQSAIKITPSRNNCNLGKKSIPCYFGVNNTERLSDVWNYDLYIRSKSSSNYSYNADQYNGTAVARNPLNYSLQDYSIFKVEGHIGKSLDSVESAITSIIRQSNLPIRLLSVQIEKNVLTVRPWPWRKIDDIRVIHRVLRKDLISRFDTVKKYNQRLDAVVSGSVDLPDDLVDEPAGVFKSNVKSGVAKVVSKTDTMKSKLTKPLESFDRTTFAKEFTDAATDAASLNKSVKGLTFTSVYSPNESIVNDSRYLWLGWFKDHYDDRMKKSRELSIFEKFLQNHPGLEHAPGVVKGGTFVLVYTSDKTVIGDFSLPYWIDIQDEDTEDDIQDFSDDKIDWIKENNIVVKVPKDKLLVDKYDKLQDKIDLVHRYYETLDVKIKANESVIDIVQGNIKTFKDSVIEKIDINKDRYSVGGDKEMDYLAGYMETLNGKMSELDEKIKNNTATQAERTARANYEKAAVEASKMTNSILTTNNQDVAVGSSTERLVKNVAITLNKISNTVDKNALISGMNNAASGKVNMGAILNNYNIRL
jgi:hypothetical protein